MMLVDCPDRGNGGGCRFAAAETSAGTGAAESGARCQRARRNGVTFASRRDVCTPCWGLALRSNVNLSRSNIGCFRRRRARARFLLRL